MPLAIYTRRRTSTSGALEGRRAGQILDPAHLVFPATFEFDLPGGTLLKGSNRLNIRTRNDSWFTWDALTLVLVQGLHPVSP